jgi:hypothetical protein
VQRNGSGDFSGNYITGTGFYADATYYMQMSGANPNLVFDTNDYLAYDRTNNSYNFQIAGNGIFKVTPTYAQSLQPFVLPMYTVATLPTGIQGAMAYVTDALAPMYNTTVVGGGSSVVRVFFDGTSWKT